MNALHNITLTIATLALLTGGLAATGCIEADGPGNEEDIDSEDQWPDEPIDDAADEEDINDADSLAAARAASCSRAFDTAWPNGWNVSGAVTVDTIVNRGVAGIGAISYNLQNGHPNRGGNNKIGVKFQTYSSGKWRNATDWVYWARDLGTSSHDDHIGLGVRTTRPTRARIRFSWDVRWAKDPAKSCYVRIQ